MKTKLFSTGSAGEPYHPRLSVIRAALAHADGAYPRGTGIAPAVPALAWYDGVGYWVTLQICKGPDSPWLTGWYMLPLRREQAWARRRKGVSLERTPPPDSVSGGHTCLTPA